MVFETKAGSFVLNTTTGNQTITGVGFQPTGILFFAVGAVTEGTSAIDARYSYGMTDGTTDHCSTVTAEDGVATHTERRSNITQIINMMNAATAVEDITVTHVSMNSDGFVINVGANINSEAILVKYFAMGGTTNLVVAEVAASGSPVTTLGFQPNLLFAMCSGQVAGSQTSMHALHGSFGCAERFSASTREWRHVGFFGEDDRAQSSNSVLNDGFCGQVYNNATTWEITLTTFDTGGFTWGGTNADGFQYMAIELPTGIEAFVGTFAKSAGGAPATQTLPNSTFTPQSYILVNGHDTSLTIPTAQTALHSIGAYSQPGTASQWNISVASEIAAGSQADCRGDATNAIIETALGGGTVASAVPQTITDSTPDIIWNPNTGTTDFIGYLAFEEDAAAGLLKEPDNATENISEGIVLALRKTIDSTVSISEAENHLLGLIRVEDETANISETVNLALRKVQDSTVDVNEALNQLLGIIKTDNVTEEITDVVNLGLRKTKGFITRETF